VFINDKLSQTYINLF